MKKIFTLIAVALVAMSVNAQTTVFSWEGAADAAIVSGGSVEAKGDAAAPNTAKAGYYTLQLDGAKDFSGKYYEITVTDGYKAGDKISVTGFRSKDGSEVKRSGIIFKFANDATINSDDMGDSYIFVNINKDGADYAGEGVGPNTLTFEVPEGADGQKLLIARGRTQTNMWVTKLVITRGGATGIQSVKDENTANGEVYNLAGQKVDKSYKGVVIQNGVKRIQK